MYQVQNSQTLVAVHRRLFTRGRTAPLVARTVMLLGLTSLLHRHLVRDGLDRPAALPRSRGSASRRRVRRRRRPLPGRRRDRPRRGRLRRRPVRRHKEVAASATACPPSASSGSSPSGGAVGALSAVIVLDRTGKGIRTAPRDAMISLSTPQGAARHGVRRAPRAGHGRRDDRPAARVRRCSRSRPAASTRSSWSASASRSSASASLVLFVQNKRARGAVEPRAEPRPAGRSARVRARSAKSSVLDRRRARRVLGLATIERRLRLPRAAASARLRRRAVLPLLYVGTSLVYMVLAVPVGRLADRVGRGACSSAATSLLLVRLRDAARCRASAPRSLVARAAAPRHLLRRDRRRADGAGQRAAPRGAARQRARAARHGRRAWPGCVASLLFGLLWTLARLQTRAGGLRRRAVGRRARCGRRVARVAVPEVRDADRTR